MTEPPDASMVLVEDNAVWMHDDSFGEEDFVNPDFHWWKMDGGDWFEDPLPWKDLETKDWVQLVRVDPKRNLNQEH